MQSVIIAVAAIGPIGGWKAASNGMAKPMPSIVVIAANLFGVISARPCLFVGAVSHSAPAVTMAAVAMQPRTMMTTFAGTCATLSGINGLSFGFRMGCYSVVSVELYNSH